MGKNVVKWFFGLFVASTLLYGGWFYLKWFYPDKDIPTPPEMVGQSRTGDGFEALAPGFNQALIAAQQSLKVPAISAAVYVDGKFVWAGAQGYADIETMTPVTPAFKFRLGSTSKIFTAALAYKMQEQGLVDVSAPISTYLPDLPEDYASLTLRELLSHSAGVRNYQSNLTMFPPHEGLSDDRYASATEALTVFMGDKLAFTPDEGFQYSSWGFVLASAVLEAAGGADFPTLLEDKLFKPAGLDDTMAEFSGRAEAPLVSFYTTREGNYTRAYPVDTSVKWAAGGLISTPEDVAEYGDALLRGKILGDASLAAIWTPVALADGSINEQNYGQGFRIDTARRLFGEDHPTRVYHHGGLVDGGSSFFMIVPEYGITVSALANTDEVSAREGVQELASELVRIAARNGQEK